MGGYRDGVRQLLAAGGAALREARDNAGRRCVDLARQAGFGDIVAVLNEHAKTKNVVAVKDDARTVDSASFSPAPRAMQNVSVEGGTGWTRAAILGEHACDIPVVDATALSATSFMREFVSAERPVLIKGLVNAWPARKSWKRKRFVELREASTLDMLCH